MTLVEQLKMSDSVNPSPLSLRIDARKLCVASLVTPEGCLLSIFDPADQAIAITILFPLEYLTTLREQLVAVQE